MGTIRYISVILPLKLEWEPCYAVDPVSDHSGGPAVGDRVRVMFARHEYVGVVSEVDITPDISPERIQPVLSVESKLEKILPEEIALWREVAEYYMCSVGEVYKAAYPAVKVSLEEARAVAKMKVQARRDKFLEAMRVKVARVGDRLARKNELIEKAREGTRYYEKLKEDRGRIEKELAIALQALQRVELSGSEGCDLPAVYTDPTPVELSRAQCKAYDEILQGFMAGKPVLLNGVTGSGKTEIYVRLAVECLLRGQNVLYLVPEIALSRQLEDRLRKHLGDGLLVFHSGESAASRRNAAETIRETQHGYVVLGTRSSLFLPHHDLGLIIVDEEHDNSYKQDSPAPRYNGRDAALMLFVIQTKMQEPAKTCNILMGSATPSLEEIYNCHAGRHAMVKLSERYHGAHEADIEIIDTKAERRKNGMVGNFSRKLIAQIEQTVAEGGQVMILRSRRSWAPVVQCDGCGDIVRCPHCNVSLSLHKKSAEADTLVCHYCGYKTTYVCSCQKCSGVLKPLGAGTQKIEEEAQALFPGARVARLDSDAGHNKSYETQTIKAFANGEIDILVGTQMLAKGFDFSNLCLVAAIAADSLLGVQDFRADEKASQLLEQFKGRCGRREAKGRIVIQTAQPQHPVYANISSSEDAGYISQLMQERRDFMFPPYARIVELTIRDKYEDRAGRMAARLAEVIGRYENMHVTGPYAPVIDKVADMYIRSIRISLRKDRNLRSAKTELKAIITQFEKDYKYDGHITINVDPS